MKEAMEFHIDGLEEFPKAKGLKCPIENGTFNEDNIDEIII